MFHGIISTSALSDYIETYTALVDEAAFEFGPDGITGEPVDPANVGMINQTLHPAAFESYSSEEFTIGFNLNRFQDYADSIRSDLVELEFDEETSRFTFSGEETTLTMAAINPDSIRNGQDINDLDLEHVADVTLDAPAFTHAIDIVDLVTDHFRLTADPGGDRPLVASGDGDMDDAEVAFDSSIQEGSTIDAQAESLISIDYLKDLKPVLPSDANLRVQVGNEMPVRIDYEYLDGNAEATFLIAPRIVNE